MAESPEESASFLLDSALYSALDSALSSSNLAFDFVGFSDQEMDFLGAVLATSH